MKDVEDLQREIQRLKAEEEVKSSMKARDVKRKGLRQTLFKMKHPVLTRVGGAISSGTKSFAKGVDKQIAKSRKKKRKTTRTSVPRFGMSKPIKFNRQFRF